MVELGGIELEPLCGVREANADRESAGEILSAAKDPFPFEETCSKKLVELVGIELEPLCGREGGKCRPGVRRRNPERSEGPLPF